MGIEERLIPILFFSHCKSDMGGIVTLKEKNLISYFLAYENKPNVLVLSRNKIKAKASIKI